MEKSVLISLGDDKLKSVAEVLGNSSCVKILDLLGGEDLTVSDLSDRLKMKLNTCDYNVKKLVRAGLIEKSDYWWSVKGRKMIVYRVCDRQIVISPRRSVARKFLWVLGLTGVAGIWIRSLTRPVEFVNMNIESVAVFDAAPKTMELMATNAGMTQKVIESVSTVGFWAGLAGWEWFLFGAWSSIILFFTYSLISERRYR